MKSALLILLVSSVLISSCSKKETPTSSVVKVSSGMIDTSIPEEGFKREAPDAPADPSLGTGQLYDASGKPIAPLTNTEKESIKAELEKKTEY
jgi:hypothetical protein